LSSPSNPSIKAPNAAPVNSQGLFLAWCAVPQSSKMTGTDLGVSSTASNCLSAVDVLVLAGGLGTRIRTVLGETPKLLAPIGGRTYLDYLLDWLARFGPRRVVLGLGYRAEAIAAHLARREHKTPAIEILVEPQPLGTAGAIRFARPALASDPALIVNGDSFGDVDLCKFYDYHRGQGKAGTMLCTLVDDAGRYGRVQLDEHGKVIIGFIEKDPTFHGRALINAGMYFLSASLLDAIAAGDATSLEKDVFERLSPTSLAAFTECANFIDIGTPESLAQADRVFGASAY
jgi:mannose-1-phosphate guanylyltransferase